VYLYSFDRFFGFDKVCRMTDDSAEDNRRWKKWQKIKPGDLLIFGNQYFLALGENLAFAEQYQHLTTTQAELVYKEFLSAPALKLFHRMVETYYTTYKSVVRLFFADDIEKLLERENKLNKIAKNWQKLALLVTKIDQNKFNFASEWQTLIVFPDLRTMFNSVPSERLNDKMIKWWNLSEWRNDEMIKPSKEDKWWNVVTLLASDTQNQKDVHRWEIKKWMKSVILCTYAEIFQDFHDLKKIIFVDPHKRYYANQQDPRYKVGEVIEEMKKLYWVDIEIMGV